MLNRPTAVTTRLTPPPMSEVRPLNNRFGEVATTRREVTSDVYLWEGEPHHVYREWRDETEVVTMRDEQGKEVWLLDANKQPLRPRTECVLKKDKDGKVVQREREFIVIDHGNGQGGPHYDFRPQVGESTTESLRPEALLDEIRALKANQQRLEAALGGLDANEAEKAVEELDGGGPQPPRRRQG